MSVPYNTNYDLTMPFVDDSAQIALGVIRYQERAFILRDSLIHQLLTYSLDWG